MANLHTTINEEDWDPFEDDYEPAWVQENRERGIEMQFEAFMADDDSEEEILQFDDVIENEHQMRTSTIDEIDWDGDHNYFFPEPEEFDEPTSFINGTEITAASSPLFILKIFLDESIIREIVVQTNKYATDKGISKWEDITADEFWKFLALNVLMGVIQKPSLKDYWSRNELHHIRFFGDTMSRNRFEQILRGLHFVNLEDRTLDKADRFHKLGIIMPKLLENFRKIVNPGEFLTIDEELMPYKGRLSFKQYNAKKRGRFGVESFFLMDAERKYVLDILPYQGQTTKIGNEDWKRTFGFGGAAVLTLLGKGYLGKNHRLVLDNYFQSPRLAKLLVRNDTFVLGTVRKDRKFMPKFDNKLKKGQLETISDGDILLERWGDRREVLMLNKFIEHRMEDCESTNPSNQRMKPASVLVYNKTMGALDDMDQIIRPYQTLRKSLKWYRKYALHLFDISIYNSFVIFCNLHPDAKKDGYKNYLLQIIKEMVENHKSQRAIKGRPPLRPINASNQQHSPQTINHPNGKKKRSNCHICTKNKKRKATQFQCSVCKVWLCVSGQNTCFMIYHKS